MKREQPAFRGGMGPRPRGALWVFLSILLAGHLVTFGEDFGDRVETREDGWPVPDPEQATPQGRRWLDRTPQIEDKETKAVGFVGRKFPLFVVWSIDGERFAVIIDEDGRAPFEYGLWDMDGDGKFETKTGAYRNIEAPQWVVDKYFIRRGQVPPSKRKMTTQAEKSEPAGGASSEPH